MDQERGSELIPLSDAAPLPTFDLSLRGYDRRQVDEYLDRLEHTLSVTQADRDGVSARTQALQRRVDELQAEIESSRQELLESARPTYAGLGDRVAQLLRLAEEEAEQLRAEALRDVSHIRDNADELLAEAEQRAAMAERDFESALAARRQQAEQEDADKRNDLQRQLKAAEDRLTGSEMAASEVAAAAQAQAAQLRRDAEQHAAALVHAARHDAERIMVEARNEAEHILVTANTAAEQRRKDSDAEIAQLVRRRDTIHQQLASVREVLGGLPVDSAAEPAVDHRDQRTGPAHIIDHPGHRSMPAHSADQADHRTVAEQTVESSLAELSRSDRSSRESRN